MTSPAERFNSFMRREISPALRQLGLRGSVSRGFELPDDRSWALIGFDRHGKDSRAGETRFTVNLTFVPKAVWDRTREAIDWVGPRPSPNSSHGWRGVEVVRLGNLMPGGEDRWWTIDEPHAEPAIAAEVVSAIRDLGLPWLRARMADPDQAARSLVED